jgi:transcriptional regulator with XRE-family HTH domain
MNLELITISKRVCEKKWKRIDDVDEEFSKRLRRLRENKHPVRSMEVTGGLMGLSTPGMLRRYERGEAEPSASALVKIADYYNVSIDYLLNRTNYK